MADVHYTGVFHRVLNNKEEGCDGWHFLKVVQFENSDIKSKEFQNTR